MGAGASLPDQLLHPHSCAAGHRGASRGGGTGEGLGAQPSQPGIAGCGSIAQQEGGDALPSCRAPAPHPLPGSPTYRTPAAARSPAVAPLLHRPHLRCYCRGSPEESSSAGLPCAGPPAVRARSGRPGPAALPDAGDSPVAVHLARTGKPAVSQLCLQPARPPATSMFRFQACSNDPALPRPCRCLCRHKRCMGGKAACCAPSSTCR